MTQKKLTIPQQKMKTIENYQARILSTDRYGMNKRNVGDIVYVHIFEDGQVLLFDPVKRDKGKVIAPTFDVIFHSIEDVKQFATCISKTDFDVKDAWDKVMSDRYW